MKPRTSELLSTVAWAAVLALAACSRPAVLQPNVIVIVSDALRADHIGRPRADPSLTPFLDELVRTSTLFENARAQCSWTSPSIASLFTSTYQSQHQVLRFRSRLTAEKPTLAETLNRAGYRTAAFSGNVLIAPRNGFGRGFESFVKLDATLAPKPRAEEINREVLAWLDAMPEAPSARPPLFIYLHYMETHMPYGPDREPLERVLKARGRDQKWRNDLGEQFFHPEKFQPPTKGSAELLHDLYEAELVSLDVALPRFWQELDKRGVLGGAVVVFTADHGEEFFEHGDIGHGRTLYDEVLRVPLLIRGGGFAAGARSAEIVSLVDLAPTLTAAAGVASPASFEGRALQPPSTLSNPVAAARVAACSAFNLGCSDRTSLAELIRPPEASLAARVHQQRSLARAEAKVIQMSDGALVSFDLRTDPSEHGVPAPAPGQTESLARTLGEMVAALSPAQGAEAHAEIDQETKERMRRLGYEPD